MCLTHVQKPFSSQLHQNFKSSSNTTLHARTYTRKLTCAFADDLHHGGWKVAHAVISCPVVMDTAFPASVGVLLQNLRGEHIHYIKCGQYIN